MSLLASFSATYDGPAQPVFTARVARANPQTLYWRLATFDEGARAQVLTAFGEPGAVEKTGPSLGIAFSDQLLPGWDLAKATGQDLSIPDGLAEAAYNFIHGHFAHEQRKGVFKPEIAVASGAPVQDKLLGYTGRDPSR